MIFFIKQFLFTFFKLNDDYDDDDDDDDDNNGNCKNEDVPTLF